MRDAGHRTPDAGHRTSDNGHRTSDGEKSKKNISTPQGGGHNNMYLYYILSIHSEYPKRSKRNIYKQDSNMTQMCPSI